MTKEQFVAPSMLTVSSILHTNTLKGSKGLKDSLDTFIIIIIIIAVRVEMQKKCNFAALQVNKIFTSAYSACYASITSLNDSSI